MLEFCRRGTLSSSQLLLGIDQNVPYLARQVSSRDEACTVLLCGRLQGWRLQTTKPCCTLLQYSHTVTCPVPAAPTHLLMRPSDHPNPLHSRMPLPLLRFLRSR